MPFRKSGVYQLKLVVEIPCIYKVFYISGGCLGISAINSMKGNQVASYYRPIGEIVGLIWGKSWQVDVRLNQRFTPWYFNIRFGNHVASKRYISRGPERKRWQRAKKQKCPKSALGCNFSLQFFFYPSTDPGSTKSCFKLSTFTTDPTHLPAVDLASRKPSTTTDAL